MCGSISVCTDADTSVNQTKISALLDPFLSAVLFSRNLAWAAYVILNFLVPTFKKKKQQVRLILMY